MGSGGDMLPRPISDATKRAVRERARFLCEYCYSSERLSASHFTVEHVKPKSLGGTDKLENLALVYRRCNEGRHTFVASVDPKSQAIAPIFNPRLQR